METTHHANLLVGSHDWALTQLPQDVREQSQDVIHLTFERMSIADVRSLIRAAHLRPIERPDRTFVVYAHSLLSEAQNALLKLLEDPPQGVIFYFIVPNANLLLPTVRSRFNELESERADTPHPIFEEFKAANYGARLALIASWAKDDDTTWFADLRHGLEQYASTIRDPKLMHDTLLITRYADAPGSSRKMLLEHLALTL